METTAIKPGRPKGRKTQFKGIGKAAQRLGVTTDHLRQCLQGKRQSEPLLTRYYKLKTSTKTPKRKL